MLPVPMASASPPAHAFPHGALEVSDWCVQTLQSAQPVRATQTLAQLPPLLLILTHAFVTLSYLIIGGIFYFNWQHSLSLHSPQDQGAPQIQ